MLNERKDFCYTNRCFDTSELHVVENREADNQLVPKQVVLSWRSISAQASNSSPINKSIEWLKTKKTKNKNILENINGIVQPGEVLALMGAR